MPLLFMGQGRSRVRVTDDELRVEMGWAYRSTVPRSAIRSNKVRSIEYPIA